MKDFFIKAENMFASAIWITIAAVLGFSYKIFSKMFWNSVDIKIMEKHKEIEDRITKVEGENMLNDEQHKNMYSKIENVQTTLNKVLDSQVTKSDFKDLKEFIKQEVQL